MSVGVFYQALGLKGYVVEDSWEGKNGALWVRVSVPRESLRCRCCRSRCVHVHESKDRFWKAAPLGLTPVIVAMRTPRVKCLTCGKQPWHQPAFADGQRRMTKGFEQCLASWLSRLTIQDVVEMFGLSWNTVAEIDLRRLKKLARPSLQSLKRLAIDEKYLGKKHQFITVVLDLERRAIVSVSKGRGEAALKGFFSRLKRAGVTIKAVATDMAGGYIAAVIKHLTGAKLVFDHFHVIKLMNEKLTILRRELYHELKDRQQRNVLKGVRYLLLKNPENLKQTDRVDEQANLAAALALNEPLSQAYYLKDELRQFWQQPSKAAAEKFLTDWCRRADATGIRVLKTMSKTLLGHRTGLLNWYDEPISTGPLEGTNNKIGLLQRRAYGFRNYEHLKERLLTLHHAKFSLVG